MDPVITVGLDGSAESRTAALWAAREAALRHRTLRMLHAWILLSVPEKPATDGTAGSDRNYWAKRIVDGAQLDVHQRFPELPVVGDIAAEDPGPALVAACAESEMLVLGSRGMSPIRAFFLGDIGLYVVARADRPVVLVRAQEDLPEDTPRDAAAAGPPPAAEGAVVLCLGLHGPCEDLFAFAFDIAARRGATLHAVHGRSLPAQAYAPWGVDPDVAEELAADARGALGDAVHPWRERFPEVRVRESVYLESPARAVAQAAAGAGLLVVGRRRRRPALTPAIGPVLQSALHHAPCPVAVAPHD
ncbi:universal stress protein [Streptomyces sp. ISL-11]|uniref:universal stress protein n=1 Tax=Streptomyces sp. ISL-11 TaxID=2819174 RepID=UPI001BE6F20F|nr:universal stress protein [Streptomyces sp. ISL-11]MBT2382977.1 universal stress protein [Streptomyces sp. ISL-11]